MKTTTKPTKKHILSKKKIDLKGMPLFWEWILEIKTFKRLLVYQKGEKKNVYFMELPDKKATVFAIDIEERILDSTELFPMKK